MIKLPLETFKLYQDRLSALGISICEATHLITWVRYFVDFEAKSGKAAVCACGGGFIYGEAC